MRYAQSLQAYTDEGYRALLNEAGFHSIEFYTASGENIAHTDPQTRALFYRVPEVSNMTNLVTR